ncbi:NAD(P)/FAD-dependent oxidoreductase [Metabacillus malikii]|uniref:Thioredoxin reductase n=1 Tax=Metabacillus malikii TaxID=1504265 RepID=A0ABT9ZBS0_9BACI|nr:NAD(P)/FAD-dependent oxidoreductase [Metabacillus malikii]MDQ0229708.1 thioredoxin reductase [Metabacillus malikii]
MNVFDCIVIGGGPAGLSASLVLGRARRKVALFDDGTNRNRVTHESHGFLTRDGIKPQEFKQIGLKELKHYPNVSYFNKTVTEIIKDTNTERFMVQTNDGQEYITEKIMLASGIQERFSIQAVREFYGKSLFSCTYCDGWELRDKPLIVIAEQEDHAIHMARLVYNWSKDLIVLTNGVEVSIENNQVLEKHNIKINTEPIKNLVGEDGYLQKVELISGETIIRAGGFVVPSFYRPNHFVEMLGCEVQENGTVVNDGVGRTTQKNIYIAGESEKSGPSSLMISAADGFKTAVSVNTDITFA